MNHRKDSQLAKGNSSVIDVSSKNDIYIVNVDIGEDIDNNFYLSCNKIEKEAKQIINKIYSRHDISKVYKRTFLQILKIYFDNSFRKNSKKRK